jgi:hypothetical protein
MPAADSASPLAEQAQDRLAELTAAARQEHLAVGLALGNALHHAMAAGDALLAMRELVPAGRWQAYVRDKTDISERSAQVYIRVANTSGAPAAPMLLAAAIAPPSSPSL